MNKNENKSVHDHNKGKDVMSHHGVAGEELDDNLENYADTPTDPSSDTISKKPEVLEPRPSMPLVSNPILPARSNANIKQPNLSTNTQSEIESSWDRCVAAIEKIIENKASSYEIENGSDDLNKGHINIKIKHHDKETISIDKLNDGRAKITIPNIEHSKDFIHDFISNNEEQEVRINNVSLAQAKLFIDACDAKDLHKLSFPGLESANDKGEIANLIKEKIKNQNENSSRIAP